MAKHEDPLVSVTLEVRASQLLLIAKALAGELVEPTINVEQRVAGPVIPIAVIGGGGPKERKKPGRKPKAEAPPAAAEPPEEAGGGGRPPGDRR